MNQWTSKGICSLTHPSVHLPRAALVGLWADGIASSLAIHPYPASLRVGTSAESVKIISDIFQLFWIVVRDRHPIDRAPRLGMN
jgi:hypothetical protein